MFAELISSGTIADGPIQGVGRCACGIIPKSGICIAGALGTGL